MADDARQVRLMSVTAGVAGLASLVLVFGGQAFVLAGGGEPAFDAPPAEIADFVAKRDDDLYPVGSYLSVLFALAFVWFLAGLYGVLRRVEGEPPWRSRVALVSGLVFASALTGGGWDYAVFRRDDGIDQQYAMLAFDLGNLGFANSWVVLGGFAVAAGWAMVVARSLPSWLGWVAVVAGVGLIAARAVWTSSFWLAPYSLFWLWLIAVCVVLFRHKPEVARG
jgi:hypothetical protein